MNKNKLFFPTLALLYITLFLTACTEVDSDVSLLEPAFQRCHLSKYYMDNNLILEVVYDSDTDYQIEKVLYYQNNAVREDWTEVYTYEDGKIIERRDDYESYRYEYNSDGNLTRITNCDLTSNSCCRVDFDYFQGSFPQSSKISCDDGSSSMEFFEYANLQNRSHYYYFTYQNNTQVSSYMKFPQALISPFYEIFPSQLDYYQDWRIEDYKNKQFIEFAANDSDLLGSYPKKLTRITYSLPELIEKNRSVLSYEYVGCD